MPNEQATSMTTMFGFEKSKVVISGKETGKSDTNHHTVRQWNTKEKMKMNFQIIFAVSSSHPVREPR